MKTRKIKQKGQIKRSLEYMGIPVQHSETFYPTCYDEGW